MRTLVIGANSLSGAYMCRYLKENNQDFIGTKQECERGILEQDIVMKDINKEVLV